MYTKTIHSLQLSAVDPFCPSNKIRASKYSSNHRGQVYWNNNNEGMDMPHFKAILSRLPDVILVKYGSSYWQIYKSLQ